LGKDLVHRHQNLLDMGQISRMTQTKLQDKSSIVQFNALINATTCEYPHLRENVDSRTLISFSLNLSYSQSIRVF